MFLDVFGFFGTFQEVLGCFRDILGCFERLFVCLACFWTFLEVLDSF